MHHSDFIAVLADIYRPKVYLELGVHKGETWNKVKPFCERMVGVDIKNYGVEGEIYIETTEKFFGHFNSTINMAFIDADHNFERAFNDLMRCLDLLRSNGVVILHDTDPETDDLIAPGYCGDSFKIVDAMEHDPRVEFFNLVTLPVAEAGLTIFTIKGNTRTQRRRK